MGKLKDLVTDVTFTLTNIEKILGNDVYTYTGTNGAILRFHSHPTETWSWVVLSEGTNKLGHLCAEGIIDAFVSAGVNRGNVPFEEAIKVLEI